ncbi:hypothetical protein FGO68_gene3321 [Halteria grandinella]|uniref:Uncharacterized protein n=1 Tax=Halteria grandinella TaxID=5974 RepID=A0A8J8NQ23_HALGN|nr:hypothetical protein FGO68_gene3321 [Halteria grandinella]
MKATYKEEGKRYGKIVSNQKEFDRVFNLKDPYQWEIEYQQNENSKFKFTIAAFTDIPWTTKFSPQMNNLVQIFLGNHYGQSSTVSRSQEYMRVQNKMVLLPVSDKISLLVEAARDLKMRFMRLFFKFLKFFSCKNPFTSLLNREHLKTKQYKTSLQIYSKEIKMESQVREGDQSQDDFNVLHQGLLLLLH